MEDFIIRRAEIADAGIIAHHRARMFYDMGDVPDAIFDEFRAGSERWLTNAFRNGEYIGWLTSEKSSPEEILAGAGVQLRRVAPHPLKKPNGEVTIAVGRHGIVINVFTEPEWRRRGLAEALMREIVEWARGERLDRLLLHASKDGRRLYERLGFIDTNEMRFAGDLTAQA
jgi:GNAT superfamily N-acetyltransferase